MKILIPVLLVLFLSGCTGAEFDKWNADRKYNVEMQERKNAPYKLACIQSGGQWVYGYRCDRPKAKAPVIRIQPRQSFTCRTYGQTTYCN